MSKHNRQRRQVKDDKRVHKVQLTLTLTKKADGRADQHYDVHCSTLLDKDVVFALRTAADLLEQKRGPMTFKRRVSEHTKGVTDGAIAATIVGGRGDVDGAGEPAPQAGQAQG